MSPRAGLDTQTLTIAAAEIADEQGWEAVTLAALAAKMGVRSPSLYNHISGLQDLRNRMTLYGMQQLHLKMNAAITGMDGNEAVHALAKAYIGFARERPGLYETTLRAPMQGIHELEVASTNLLSLIMKVLKPYNLGKEGELHAIRGLRSILHGFASLEQKGGFAMALDTSTSLELIMNSFIQGMECMRNKLSSDEKDHGKTANPAPEGSRH